MFDDTIGAMEQQSRSAPAEDIALQTSKAVDKILNQGQLATSIFQPSSSKSEVSKNHRSFRRTELRMMFSQTLPDCVLVLHAGSPT